MSPYEDVSNTVVHVRADRSAWDLQNIFVEPLKELLRFRELIKNIVSRDLKVRYKRSILGIAWTILSPLLSMVVLWAVFTYAFRVQIPFYASYLLSGIIVWNFFLQSSNAGCHSILNGAALIRKIKLSRVIFPITVIVNNLVNFGFAFVALLLVTLVIGAPIHATSLLVPVMLVPLVLFATGWAMMVSALSVFFRDLQYILEILLGALFYMTPILFDASSLPETVHLRWFNLHPRLLISLNPMAKFIHLFKSVFYYGQLPHLHVYLTALAMGSGMLVFGWVVFQRLQKRFIYWL